MKSERVHGRNEYVNKRMDGKINWMRSGMVEKDIPQFVVDERRGQKP